MGSLDGTPEGDLLQNIGVHKLRTDLAANAAQNAERHLAAQTDQLNQVIGHASIQLILMSAEPGIPESEKLAFGIQILQLKGEDSLDSKIAVEQLNRFVVGEPIVFVGEYPVMPRVITSEPKVAVHSEIGDKPGFRMYICCRTRGINHLPNKEEPNPFYEFDSGIDVTHLSDTLIGLPALQQYIDAFPGTTPTNEKERKAYTRRLTHVFSSIKDMKELGVEGVDQLRTTRLEALWQNAEESYDNSWNGTPGERGW